MKKLGLFLLTCMVTLLTTFSYSGCHPMSTLTTYPQDESTNNLTTISEIRFSLETFNFGSSNIVHNGNIRIYNNMTNDLLQTIDINDYYTYGHVINDSIMEFPILFQLQDLTEYRIEMDDLTIWSDCSGGTFQGWYMNQFQTGQPYNEENWTFTTGNFNTSSINEKEDNQTIYPTIINEGYINLPKNTKSIEIFDLSGKIVYSNLSINSNRLNVGHLNVGTYIIYVNRKRSIKVVKR